MQQNDISIIASRVESLEGRLDDNIEKINNRLDLIVDLMQKVTALQEREISNGVQINELKVSIKETNQTIKDWNHHIHERLDRHYSDMKMCREGIDATIENLEDEVHTELKKNSEKTQSTQEELAKWLNRGIGAWALASLLLIVVQGMGAYVISGIIDGHKKNEESIAKIEDRVIENEKTISTLVEIVRSQNSLSSVKH